MIPPAKAAIAAPFGPPAPVEIAVLVFFCLGHRVCTYYNTYFAVTLQKEALPRKKPCTRIETIKPAHP